MLRSSIAAGAVLGVIALSACGSLSACGLSVVESRNDPSDPSAVDAATALPDSSVSSSSSTDAADGSDGAPMSTQCSETSTACTAALSAGWTPVALPSTPGGACPGEYTARDLVKASVPSDACTCAPSVMPQDPPSCDKDEAYVGGTSVAIALCLESTPKLKIDGSACTPVAGSSWISAKFDPIVHLGTCVAACSADTGKLAKTPVRVCEPPSRCAESACLGANAGGPSADGLRYCLAHDGDVECPGDAGASVREVVANDAAFTCEGATCANDVKCENAKLDLFKDGACNGSAYKTIDANGKCNAIDGGGPKSLKYTATKTPLPSKMVEPAKPTINLAGSRTICCRSLG